MEKSTTALTVFPRSQLDKAIGMEVEKLNCLEFASGEHSTIRARIRNARLKEMAIAYFQERLNAISADISALENPHCESRLFQDEFVAIHRSILQAKAEVQVALDGIALKNK